MLFFPFLKISFNYIGRTCSVLPFYLLLWKIVLAFIPTLIIYIFSSINCSFLLLVCIALPVFFLICRNHLYMLDENPSSLHCKYFLIYVLIFLFYSWCISSMKVLTFYTANLTNFWYIDTRSSLFWGYKHDHLYILLLFSLCWPLFLVI